MGNLQIATIFIVLVNILMWFCSIAMLEINPSGTICYNLDGTIIDNTMITSGNMSVLDNNVLDDLPTAAGSTITPGETSVSFTDIFNNILSWFKSAPGVKYIYGVVAAPYNILKCMNLPNNFTMGIGTFWYLISLLTLTAFLWGRE